MPILLPPLHAATAEGMQCRCYLSNLEAARGFFETWFQAGVETLQEKRIGKRLRLAESA